MNVYGEGTADLDCEDQCMAATTVCIKFECQDWSKGVRLQPRLKLKGNFYCCPKCGASYGTNPHPTLPPASGEVKHE